VNDVEQVLLPPWSHRIRMFTSARLWKSFLLVFGIPATLLSLVVAFTSGIENGTIVLFATWGVLAFLWALVGAIIDVTGGFTAAYVVTSEGVRFRLGKGARGAADAATMVGVLAGSTAAAGAGLLARSEQDAFIAWRDVRKVTIRERSRYIQIRAGLGSKPVGIYCTEQNFLPLCALVRARPPSTAG